MNPPRLPLMRASGPKPFAKFLSDLGAPVSSLWDRAGLPPRALEEEDSFVPLHGVARFAEAAARAEGLPDLGIRVGMSADFASSGEFQRRVARSRTLYDAFTAAGALVAAHNSGARYGVSHHADFIRFFRRIDPPDLASVQVDLFTLIQMIDLVRQAAGATWRPRHVTLQAVADVARFDRFEALAEARIRAGGRTTSIAVPRTLLALPLDAASSGRSFPSDAKHFDDAWLRSAPPSDLVGALRILLASLLPLQDHDVARAAAAARMSTRTLQRRLAESGTSFSRLVDDVRFAHACRLIEDESRKMIDIALELGYSDPAHFTRAFHRWTSMSPSAFRRARRRTT